MHREQTSLLLPAGLRTGRTAHNYNSRADLPATVSSGRSNPRHLYQGRISGVGWQQESCCSSRVFCHQRWCYFQEDPQRRRGSIAGRPSWQGGWRYYTDTTRQWIKWVSPQKWSKLGYYVSMLIIAWQLTSGGERQRSSSIEHVTSASVCRRCRNSYVMGRLAYGAHSAAWRAKPHQTLAR